MIWRLGRTAIYFLMGWDGQNSENGSFRAVYPPGWGVRYFIPRCDGMRSKLRSESSSGAGLEIRRSRDLDIQKCGVQEIQRIKHLKIRIRVAQNVGKVWSSRKKKTAPFGAISGNFFHGPAKIQTCIFVRYFPWWANGPFLPGLGLCCYPPEVGK